MDKESISKTGIWNIELAKEKHKFDKLLCGAIASKYFPIRSADIGCGLGNYCRVLHYGYNWPIVDGYEGTENLNWLSPYYANIRQIDLSIPLEIKSPYDLVLCLEVGEHIPKEAEEIFINNLCKFTKKDLILSWAIPGQGGKGHVNEQSNEYIIDCFTNKGFKFNEQNTKYLRKHCDLKWFRKTIMVFDI